MADIWFDLAPESKIKENCYGSQTKRCYVIMENPEISIPLKENELEIKSLRFWPAYDRFIYEVATHVVINGFRSKINTYAINRGYIETSLSRMVKFGWIVVGAATELRWLAMNTDDYKYTQDVVGFYEIKSNMERYFSSLESDVSAEINNDPKNKFYLDIN